MFEIFNKPQELLKKNLFSVYLVNILVKKYKSYSVYLGAKSVSLEG